MIVACDLLRRGYEVFRALSPSASCDLAILKAGKLLRVEVRTGYRDRITGQVGTTRTHRADILAIAVHDGSIVYEPPIAEPADTPA